MNRVTACTNGILFVCSVLVFLAGCGVGENQIAANSDNLQDARFNYPSGITIAGNYLYVLDTHNHTIRAVERTTGAVTTVAGTPGASGYRDGTGADARFFAPSDVTSDGANLYVANGWYPTIRKVVIDTREVTTIAGDPHLAGSRDGAGDEARFTEPNGITRLGADLYVVDWGGVNLLRRVTALTGNTTSLPIADAENLFKWPFRIATDGSALFLTDSCNATILQVVLGGGGVTAVNTLAGSKKVYGADNGIGTAATFNKPTGIASDGTCLYIADTENNIIRKIDIATAEVTTLAGLAGVEGTDDGIGAAARFRHPYGVATDGTNLYVTDTHNHTIRRIVLATGTVTTLAGTPGSAGSRDSTP